VREKLPDALSPWPGRARAASKTETPADLGSRLRDRASHARAAPRLGGGGGLPPGAAPSSSRTVRAPAPPRGTRPRPSGPAPTTATPHACGYILWLAELELSASRPHAHPRTISMHARRVRLPIVTRYQQMPIARCGLEMDAERGSPGLGVLALRRA
jgi:hypothetical protein